MMIIVVLALSAVLGDPNYQYAAWLVAIAFGGFVLALDRPVWVLVPVIVTELTLYSYSVPALGIAQRLAITLVAVVLAGPALLRWARFGDYRFRRVLLPSVMLVAIATIVNAMFSQDPYIFKYLRYQVGQVLVLVLVATLIRNREDLVRICVIALAVGSLAALAANWQHFAPVTAPYGAATDSVVRVWKGRSIGLVDSPVALANQMTFILAPLLGIILCGPLRFDRQRILLGGVSFLLLTGLIFSYTRSGLFALGPGLIMMGLLLRGSRRILVVGAMVLAVVFFPALETTGLLGARYFRDADEDQSAATHEALWEVGLAVALDNAVVGIGHEHFEEVALDYLYAVNDQSREQAGASSIGEERPHNDFLSVWMSWGIFALLAYIGMFIGMLRNFVMAAKHHDLLIRGLAVGCAGGVVIYGVSSAYHNYMDSSVFLWLYAGISVALARLATPDSSVSNVPIPRTSTGLSDSPARLGMR